VANMRVIVTGGSGFIGTNLIEALLGKDVKVLNIDIAAPLCSSHHTAWTNIDILNRPALLEIFQNFRPECVVHLAARTDCNENTTVEKDYQVNTEGTENLISAIKATSSVERVVITSTQYVHRPGHLPTDDEDYDPHTVYGQSKVITEQLTRKAGLACTWTIIRPTNIWGPWHMRYRSELLRLLKKGFYLYPGKKRVTKSYGYVGNIVYYILRILEMPKETVNKKTFYLGDEPIDQLEWVNSFSQQLRGRDVYIVPRWLMYGMALVGDSISFVRGRKFIFSSTRYKSMTTDYLTPMNKTFAVLGKGPYRLEDGIRDTAIWLEMLNGKS
jgi:nucleoside-diphosphate-sugar epimerase